MRKIDLDTIEVYGIHGRVLMERAGVAVAARIRERYSIRKVTVFAGSGNNGGDGLVVARELHNAGYNVKALIAGSRNRLNTDCRVQYDTARKMGVPMEFKTEAAPGDLHGALVVDAVFGTGLARPVAGKIAEAFGAINESPCPVVAVDIPSGVSADTGGVLGTAIKADTTVTFGAPKRGHLLHPGAGHTGRLYVEDIGFPKKLFEAVPCTLLEREKMTLLMPPRPAYSHKGDYGHVLVVAGSRGKTGAALMAARACMRAGAGMVTLGVPESLADIYQGSVMEEMVLPLPDTGDGALSLGALEPVLGFLEGRADVLALGPGLGRAEETAAFVRELLARCPAPMVVDADGLNALSGAPDILKKARAPLVLTPHPGEFSRLSGTGVKEIESDRVEAALAFAKQTGAYLILKGAPAIVAEPGGEAFINSTGNPGMAKAGTGDALTGVLAACLSQGLSPLESSLLGVYAHGLAGDLAAVEKTGRSVLASDLIEAVPAAFKCLLEAF